MHAHMSTNTHTRIHALTHLCTCRQAHTPLHTNKQTCTHTCTCPSQTPPWCQQKVPPHQGPGVALHTPPRCNAASLPRTQLPWQCLGRPAEDNAEQPPLPHPPWTTLCIPSQSRSMQDSAPVEHPARPTLSYFMSGSGLLPFGCMAGNASAKTQGGSRMVGFASQKCY